jgi:4-diphosphocytidyl-2-C-methyl-D-erythritol kinase
MNMYSIVRKSPAKINLGLYLLKKRVDGYHDILTLFQTINHFDIITFTKNRLSDLIIHSEGIPIPQNRDNLIYKAYDIFKKHMHLEGGVEVNVEKRIPTGAGLGGGSSNAASTLTALNLLFETDLSPKQLEKMAAEIGSDVPFFIQGGTAVGEGRGEILTPMDMDTDYWVLLICPEVSVSTAWAYSQARIGLTKDVKLAIFESLFQNRDLRSLRDSMKNELEDVVFQRHPLLKLFKENLYKWDAFYASMSGSGSSVFGLFDRLEQAEAARSFFSIDRRVKTFLCEPVRSLAHSSWISEGKFREHETAHVEE